MGVTGVEPPGTAPRSALDVSAQIRREYLALPGLSLTLEQAARLCDVDRTTCRRALDALIREGFLRRSGNVYLNATRDGRDILATLVTAVLFAVALSVTVGAGEQNITAKVGQDLTVTPVSGPSWLNRLGIKYGESGLGRSGATYGPPPGEPSAPPPSIPLQVGRPVVLTGADLYRINCQACHRAEGAGAPPEIKSVVGAVQGSSLEFVRQQLQKKGASATEARVQADRARADLFNRIKKGGQRMPPLAHLREADLTALYGYLTELAGIPDHTATPQRTASWARLGEHVVKGTCHICHDAVGVRPSDQAMLQGTIPPLNILLQEKPIVDFLTKVRSGAAVASTDARFHYRGRMPVFAHLRDIDVAAAYMFLVDYPPQR
jgi:mono/diheme cytochrome c family protein